MEIPTGHMIPEGIATEAFWDYIYISQSQKNDASQVTHLPLVLHIYASVNWHSIGSDNDLSPIWRQAII